ncbi:MAG: aldo/keto reductase [Terrimicrobiaceae bacterium]
MTSPIDRYNKIPYRRSGNSGLDLPVISLGLWHNFGSSDSQHLAREIVRVAFDEGITHFDLANNYGPPPGSAEETFGQILTDDLGSHRDELIISTKAGYRMSPGPYGDGGSRKYLLSSLDASLRRLRLDYVDVFYHHRPDLTTPLEETMGALASAVTQGKALYAAISNYDAERTADAAAIMRSFGVPLVLHQPCYNIFNRHPEEALFNALDREGIGAVVFSPLAQGILAGKYLQGIPKDSRASKPNGFLRPEHVTEDKQKTARLLHDLARQRGQTLAQLSLAWVLRRPTVVSAIIGASRPAQVLECAAALNGPPLTKEELMLIDRCHDH